MKDDEGWLMTDEGMIDFKLFEGFALRQTDEQTDICDCRVAFASLLPSLILSYPLPFPYPITRNCLRKI